MAGRYWKEAATLIIVSRSAYSKGQVKLLQESDYNLLFLKRSQKSSFMPNAFVFPGGMTEMCDFSLDWLDVFKKCGYTQDDLIKQFRTEAPLPEFYANKSSDVLPPEVGFRITAIRETFEESGLLLGSHMLKHSQIDLSQWRKIVHEDPVKFLSLFYEFGGCPAIWDLHEWSGWLTPTSYKKRFDTAFYITFMDEIHNIAADNKEIAELQVLSPPEILELWLNDSLSLPPPQAYEVSRFLQFQLYDKLKAFASSRGKKGLQRWCPVRINTRDGFLSVFPGDDLYPEKSDHTGDDTITFDSSIEELRNVAKCLHRGEVKGMQDINFVVNIMPKFEHVLPLNYRDLKRYSTL